jgi:hypothetical protein
MSTIRSETTLTSKSDEEEEFKLKIASEKNWTSRLPFHPNIDTSTKNASDFSHSKIPTFPIVAPLFKFGVREINSDLGEKFEFGISNISDRVWCYDVTAKFPCEIGHKARIVDRDRTRVDQVGCCNVGKIDLIMLDFSICNKFSGYPLAKKIVPIEITITYMPQSKSFEDELLNLYGQHRFIIHVVSNKIRNNFTRCCVHMKMLMPDITKGENVKNNFRAVVNQRAIYLPKQTCILSKR